MFLDLNIILASAMKNDPGKKRFMENIITALILLHALLYPALRDLGFRAIRNVKDGDESEFFATFQDNILQFNQ
jgi:hypothetical protein